MKQTVEYLQLNYLYGGEVVYQPGEKLKSRMLTDFEMVYIISGEATYRANGIDYTASPGCIIFGLPGTEESYRWDPDHITRHAYFHFSTDRLPSDWPDFESWPRLHGKPAQLSVSLFRHILNHIYDHHNWPTEAPGHRDSMLVESFIDTCLESHNEVLKNFERIRPEPVRRALKWMRQQIDENPCEHFSLEQIASAAHCSSKHLCRLFTQSVGYAPAMTGTLMRMQLALVLLVRSNLNIKEIAIRCGFENPLYFSRAFSKVFGRPPTGVRKDISEGIPPPSDPLPVDVTPRIYW